MDELYYKAVDLLRQLIATPSPSGEEAAVADLAEAFLRAEGAAVERLGDNILATFAPIDSAKPTILLNSHLDTVRPVAGWTRDPFAPAEEDGRLYGLGSNDAGASGVALAAAFVELSSRPQPYNLLMLWSVQEENSGPKGLESVRDALPKIDLAVVGEPTGMRPAIAEKGLMVLDGVVTGKSGHAARDEGDNAIYRALPVIETLRMLRLPRESEVLGPVKISVTQIAAGTQHNVVPDRCTFVVDVRTTDAYSNVETLALIRDAVAGAPCTLTPRSTRLNPSGIAPTHPFVRRALMMGLEPFGSPTLSDQALMPWPSVKIGPGDSARSHTADEYIALDEIRQGLEYYVKLLDGLKI